MKFFQKEHDPTNIDFQDDILLQNKILGERDLSNQLFELKKIKNELESVKIFLEESQKISNIGSYLYNIKNDIWESTTELDNIFDLNKKNKSYDDWLNIIHPKDVKMMDKYFKINILKNKEIFDKEYRIVKRNGDITWVHGKGLIKYDKNNNPCELIGTIQDITKIKLKSNYIKKLETTKATIVTLKKYHSIIWASLLTLFLLFGFIHMEINSYDNIYSTYYNKGDVSVIGVTRGLENEKSILYHGSLLYENGHYKEALETLKKIDNNINTKFFIGITNMEIGNYDKSIIDFNEVIKHNDNLFVDQSEWLLSLCYIKLNKKIDAILILSKIANDVNHYKHKKSLELLSKL